MTFDLYMMLRGFHPPNGNSVYVLMFERYDCSDVTLLKNKLITYGDLKIK